MHEYYKILGVDISSTKEEIKSAFRKKAKQYHPDINKEKNAPDIFRKLKEAFDWLEKHHIPRTRINPNAWKVFILPGGIRKEPGGAFTSNISIPSELFKSGVEIQMRIIKHPDMLGPLEMLLNLTIKPDTKPGTTYVSGNYYVTVDEYPDLDEFFGPR